MSLNLCKQFKLKGGSKYNNVIHKQPKCIHVGLYAPGNSLPQIHDFHVFVELDVRTVYNNNKIENLYRPVNVRFCIKAVLTQCEKLQYLRNFAQFALLHY